MRSYTWQIPCDLATSECKVKIVVYDCASHTATDVSDGTFIVHGVASPTNLTAEVIAEDAIALRWQDGGKTSFPVLSRIIVEFSTPQNSHFRKRTRFQVHRVRF